MTRSANRWQTVLWGGYGLGNTGDELTLAVALKDAARNKPGRIAVLTSNVALTRELFPAHAVIPYGKPRGWLRQVGSLALASGLPRLGTTCYRRACARQAGSSDGTNWIDALTSAERLHLVGGGYLTDKFDLEYYLPPLRLAAALRLPITTSPLGLGPFSRRWNARKVAAALRPATLQVRDEASLHYCRKHGLDAVEQPDDGFRLREVFTTPPPSERTPSGPRRLGICIFHQYDEPPPSGLDSWWERCLLSLKFALPAWQIEGFCFHKHRGSDFETLRRLFARAGLNPEAVHPPEPDFRAAVRRLSRLDAIISTRFHAVVTAAVLEIPCVAVAANDYYAAKMQSAARHSRQPLLIVNPATDGAETVAAQLRTLCPSKP